MSQWYQKALSQAESTVNQYQSLAPVRQQALNELKNMPWPTRRTEAWRFTSLRPLESREFMFGESTSTIAVPNANINVPQIPDLGAIDILFSHGKLVTDLNDLNLPKGVSITALDSANTTELELLAQIKPKRHLFGLLNDALVSGGIVITVDAGVNIEQAIRVVYGAAQDHDSHARVLVRMGENASATIVEHGQGHSNSLSTAFAEYDLAKSSNLVHYRLEMFCGQAIHAGGCHFRLGEKAQLNSTVVGFGSDMSRLDIDVHHAGEYAHAELNAVYLLATGENFDLQTTVEHAVPNGTTEENVRTIVGEKAKSNFNGRIHIHRDAQKTLAELNNRNLLLSRTGKINTKPELEIYADDVKCAHGATIAEIDEKALYYLLTRGVPRKQALIMLKFGFVQELINDIPSKAIRDWVDPMLRERFVAMGSK